MPAKDIGIDLGTRNSLVFSTGRGIVLREPSVVIYDKDTEKIKAIGEEARQMAGHVTSNMEVICPIRQGMIIDFVVMEKMLKYFIAKAMGRRAFRKPRISVCVPSGITEIELVYVPGLGKGGYVNKDYLVKNKDNTASAVVTKTVKVKSGYLALRNAKAYDDANEIGQLNTGDTVQVQDSSGSTYWYVYSSRLGKSGYVNKNYLQ